ncbi:iron uptake porin [Leptolyngbya sp. FACHB-321]|uniref:iron uptake porin n=1 Tax=Leptolyngbya sp. FACHB-321 TaxID=2692807 RepID=UPI001A7EA749|nr:iron uptake porin [Leptolyngbya sp. FACHB-321]
MAKAPWNFGWIIVTVLGIGVVMPAARAGDRSISLTQAAPVLISNIQTVDAPESTLTASNEAQLDVVDQVTSVSQLSDIQPTDWAFQALQSLVERYGVIAGYPDQTYRGNRALTRYEFAAGLNAALNRIDELLAAGTADLVKKEDLAAVQKLQEEFAAELATLRGRVDALEVRAATLEKQQFSTTTKLVGEAIFAVVDLFGDASSNSPNRDQDNYNTTVSDRIRLNLLTSFSGKDLLFTRLQANNVIDPGPTAASGFTAPGNEARISFDQPIDDNSVAIQQLRYSFPLTDNVRVTLVGAGVSYVDIIDVINPLQSDSGGTISRFGRFSPLYRYGSGAGIATNISLSKSLKLELGYLAGEAENPSFGNGLFNGDYAALAQIVFSPGNLGKIAFTYVNAYNDNGLGHGTGSLLSNLSGRTVSSNSYGVEANFKLIKGLEVGGWVGYTSARSLTRGRRGDADIWNFALTLALPDLGKRGNLGGIIFGMQPRLTGSDRSIGLAQRRDSDTGFHLEAFYRYRINNNIAITPGIIWLTAPNHNDSNGDIVVGVLRTTFTF